MNETLLADLLATILDEKGVEVDGTKYWLEVYSEEEKLVFFVNSDDEDETYEYFAVVEDSMV